MSKRTYKNVCVIEEDFGEVYADGGELSKLIGSSVCAGSMSYGEGEPGGAKSNIAERICVKAYTLTNSNRAMVKLITWGASIVSLAWPDKYGEVADVALGFDDLKGYLDPTINQYMGCVLGRCANRIREGTFNLRGEPCFLAKNEDDKHHLHGGINGFGRRVWESYVDENGCVVMSYLSEGGEEGYPGAVLTSVKFKLTADNRLEIGMRASTSKPTLVNLSHGTIFNLAGHGAGEEELRKHQVSLNCDRWTVADFDDPIPIGTVRAVGGTIMDLRVPRPIGDILYQVPGSRGFDHNFCVLRSSQPELTFVARAYHEGSGRYLEVYSDQPGVQLYTCGRLPPYPRKYEASNTTSSKSDSSYECIEGECDCESEKELEFLPGKSGARYSCFAGLSFQPQNYPDAVNIPHFPCAILRPGQIYYHDLVYKLGVKIDSSSCKKNLF